MAFQEVVDLSPDTVVAIGGTNRKTGKKNPNQIEGYYLGRREVEDRKKKSGKSYIYVFQTPQGNIGVWGKTDLDRKMNSAQTGTMTRVSFAGMVETPNGEMYKYKVEVDADNTIEVVGSTTVEDFGNFNDTETSMEVEEPANSEQEEENEEVSLAQVAAEAAARKAKVQALLSKNKKN